MRRRNFIRSLVFAVPLELFASAPAFADDTAREEFLRNAEIRHIWPVGEGIIGSLRARLHKGGHVHDAHVQRVDQLSSLSGDQILYRDSYRHNIAAYRLDRLLGLRMTPVAVVRQYEGSQAAFSWWVDELAMSEAQRLEQGIRPPKVGEWNKQMLIVRLFDRLIANQDRNLSNLLITKDWRIWMIDHTRTFGISRQLPDNTPVRACDRTLLGQLKALNSHTLSTTMESSLAESQIAALLARRDRLVQLVEAAIREKGEEAVLYSYLSAARG